MSPADGQGRSALGKARSAKSIARRSIDAGARSLLLAEVLLLASPRLLLLLLLSLLLARAPSVLAMELSQPSDAGRWITSPPYVFQR